MSEAEDAKRLADLLDRQARLSEKLVQGSVEENLEETKVELLEVRKQCIELVDRYFRQVLHPILTTRFPGKVTGPQMQLNAAAPVNVVAQFTQLLNDFFVQVLSDPCFDNPFWKKRTLIELRNYASIAISNRGLRDALRRRRKQESISHESVSQVYDDQLAEQVDSRFLGTDADPTDALDLIDTWDKGNDPVLGLYARLLRLHYIAGMSMEQVAADLDLSLATAYRKHKEALQAVRTKLTQHN